jgi:hypothetical protein
MAAVTSARFCVASKPDLQIPDRVHAEGMLGKSRPELAKHRQHLVPYRLNYVFADHTARFRSLSPQFHKFGDVFVPG